MLKNGQHVPTSPTCMQILYTEMPPPTPDLLRVGSEGTLKGHGIEADFLGFLQKLGPHRALTLPFEPFRFWLRIRGDIHNRKTTPRLTESGSR